VGFVARLLAHPDVAAGRLDTGLVERVVGELASGPVPTDIPVAATLLRRLLAGRQDLDGDPWASADSWRVAGPVPWRSKWRTPDGEVVEIALDGPVRARLEGDGILRADVDGLVRTYTWAADGDEVWLGRGGDSWRLVEQRETVDATGRAAVSDGQVTSPMPGTVLAVYVEVGAAVSAGVALVAVEAMKMEHVVKAPRDGVVLEVMAHPGDRVKLEQPLMVLGSGE
jgi:acetyl-CoA/propionyl-CoA carboxylase biotin carboxyl carrier protein